MHEDQFASFFVRNYLILTHSCMVSTTANCKIVGDDDGSIIETCNYYAEYLRKH